MIKREGYDSPSFHPFLPPIPPPLPSPPTYPRQAWGLQPHPQEAGRHGDEGRMVGLLAGRHTDLCSSWKQGLCRNRHSRGTLHSLVPRLLSLPPPGPPKNPPRTPPHNPPRTPHTTPPGPPCPFKTACVLAVLFKCFMKMCLFLQSSLVN